MVERVRACECVQLLFTHCCQRANGSWDPSFYVSLRCSSDVEVRGAVLR